MGLVISKYLSEKDPLISHDTASQQINERQLTSVKCKILHLEGIYTKANVAVTSVFCSDNRHSDLTSLLTYCKSGFIHMFLIFADIGKYWQTLN